MRLIVDSNCVIAALLRNSVSRKIILTSDIDFISPDFVIEEIMKYESDFIKKSNLSKQEFHVLLNIILEKIKLIKKDEYQYYLQDAENIIGKVDYKDVPFVALALSIQNNGIWSDDNHFQQQKKIKIWKTKEITEYLN